jgi:hypothetical protein
MGRKWLLCALILWAATPPGSAPHAFALTIPPNLWIQQPAPTLDLPPERAGGVYSGRGWNHMRYDSVAAKIVLFDGYAELPVYPFDEIFANALWFYDPAENRLTLEKVNNWTTESGPCLPLPENESDPTPYDRHFYSCFIYSPSKNAAYLWAGANRTIEGDGIGDTWAYDFTSRTWREITGPHPYTVYEQACAYDPYLQQMILFGGTDREYGTGNKTYTLDLETETWTDRAPSAGPSPRMGQNMVFDPVRRVTWMFAGAEWQSADNELWTYDAAANQWTMIPKQDPWPSPRRFPHFARDSRRDLILMWGGITATDSCLQDTWIFHPSTLTWQQLFPDESPPPLRFYSVDLDYDPVNDFFVLNLGGSFWLYRYADPTADAGYGDTTHGLSLRIASRSPAPDGAMLTFSLSRRSIVDVTIFDTSGRRVETLAGGSWDAGTHSLRWRGRSSTGAAASGIYFARLTSSGRTVTRKFALLR